MERDGERANFIAVMLTGQIRKGTATHPSAFELIPIRA